MKRLLLSAGLAIVLHGILLSTESRWLKKKTAHRSNSEPIALLLRYQKPQKIPTLPAKKTVDVQKAAILPKKEKKGKQPQSELPKKIKKPALTKKPIKKLRIPIRTTKPLSIQATEEIQPKVTYATPPLQRPTLPNEPQTHDTIEESLDLSAVSLEDEIQGASFKGIRDESSAPSLTPLIEAVPVYRKNPPPEYPRIAIRRGYEGTVVLEVFVSREGKVSDLRLFQSSGYRVLDRTAMASVKNWLFEPGRRGDQKVEMWVKVPIRFRLK